MKKGYIYIMTNPGLKNMVKIGYATDVEARRQQLSTTNLPYEYEVYATYETSGKLEDRKLHFLIDKLNPELRIARNREFYEMAPEDAFQLLEAIATISGTQDKLIRVMPLPATHGHNAKKPAVDFFKCGIPVGARLVYIDDPSVIATVVSERRVEYEGQLTSLSAIAKEIKGYPVAGPSFFTYNGKPVAEIARETQWKDI